MADQNHPQKTLFFAGPGARHDNSLGNEVCKTIKTVWNKNTGANAPVIKNFYFNSTVPTIDSFHPCGLDFPAYPTTAYRSFYFAWIPYPHSPP